MIENAEMKVILQNLLEWPRTKAEEHLARILNNLDPEDFDRIVNESLDLVSAAEAREYGISNFEKIDRYPNPSDGFLSRDEIAERIFVSKDSHERAVLLWIWLSFDKIRECSDDFDGTDKLFDIVLTLKDFQNMSS